MEQILRQLYLNIMRQCLTGLIYRDPSFQNNIFDLDARINGNDWPFLAHTMIGVKRIQNIQELAERIIHENIVGDFVETGVWRGGACIFMASILKSYNIEDRKVWVCDSFEGLPKPNIEKYPQDTGDQHWTRSQLVVSLDEVKENFNRYSLLNDQVMFLKGFFSETLPLAPIEKIALLRLDGDMYESTIIALQSLYSKVSIGGYVIVDDFALENCKCAVNDFLISNGLTVYTVPIDANSVYWRKA